MKGIQVDANSVFLGGAGGLVVGALAGAGIAYLVQRKAFENKLSHEVDAVKAFYNRKLKSLLEPGNATDEPSEAPGDLAGTGDNEDVGTSPVGDRADERAEVTEEQILPEARKTLAPYIISAEEFSDTPDGYQQLTMTYFAEDGILTDDKDQPVPDIAGTTGVLDRKFGGLSADPNICYVRNRKLEVDFEVVLDRRSYMDVVLNYGRPHPSSEGEK